MVLLRALSRRSEKQRSWRALTTSGQELLPLAAWSPANGMWEVRFEFFVLEVGSVREGGRSGSAVSQRKTRQTFLRMT